MAELQQQASQPDHEPELQDFFRFLESKRQQGISGALEPAEDNCHFIPDPDLQAYFGDKDRLRRILRAILPPSEPLLTDLSTIKNHYAKVFSILLCIGKGGYIDYFARYESLNDQKLPFDERPQYFPSTASVEGDFFSSFYEQQWMFCAATFTYKRHNEWQARRILPIVCKEELSGGGSAITYKIDLHPAYNSLYPRQNSQRDPADRFPNTFVLKTYGSHHDQEDYRNEVQAFLYLHKAGPEPSIIGFYGSYVHNNTSNLILEYANEGTLEDYFRKVNPPSTGQDILHFWSGLLKILRALCRIHEVEFKDPGNPQIFQGWHQDVKPKNILVSTRNGKSIYECEFKLADLGLSHFRIKVGGIAKGRDTQGTRTYGAPECYRFDSFIAKSYLHVSPKVDIWSLGCVLSEAAEWVGHGMAGLEKFRQLRKEAMAHIPDFNDPGCFHDGERVLSCVKTTHDNLRKPGSDLRASDTTTRAVLDMIDGMLYNSQDRPDAHYLWRRSRDALQQSENELNRSPRESLHQVDPRNYACSGVAIDMTTRFATDSTNSVAVHSTSPEYAQNSTSSFASTSQVLATGSSPQRSSSISFPKQTATTTLGLTYQGPPMPESSPRRATESMAEVMLAGDRISPSTLNYCSPTRPQPEGTPQHWLSGSGNYSSLPDEGAAEEHISGSRRPPNRIRNSTTVASQIYKPELSPSGFNQTQIPSGGNYQQSDGPSPHQLLGPRRIFTMPDTSDFPTEQLYQDTRPAGPQPTRLGYPHTPDMEIGRSDLGNLSINNAPVDNSLPFDSRTGQFHLGEAPNNSYPRADHPPNGAPSNGSRSFGMEASQPSLPFLSVEEASQWRDRRRRESSGSGKTRLPNEHWKDELKSRDHVFLIDNSTPMREHWEEALRLFGILAYILKRLDPDGLELYFTCTEGKHKKRNTTDLIEIARSRAPPAGVMRPSNIYVRLNSILEQYQEKLRNPQQSRFGIPRSSKDMRMLNLYVLTDGLWQPESDAETPIKHLVKTLDELDKPLNQVGIQFIRFGDDPHGRARLEHLDSGLKGFSKCSRDIVDTEPSNGNVWKMLLGSINKWFDSDANTTPNGTDFPGAARPT